MVRPNTIPSQPVGHSTTNGIRKEQPGNCGNISAIDRNTFTKKTHTEQLSACVLVRNVSGKDRIRTYEPLLTVTRFPGVPLQPLEHLSL